MLEFYLTTFPRELFQWSGDSCWVSGKGQKGAMNNSQTLPKFDCYGKGNNDGIFLKKSASFLNYESDMSNKENLENAENYKKE